MLYLTFWWTSILFSYTFFTLMARTDYHKANKVRIMWRIFKLNYVCFMEKWLNWLFQCTNTLPFLVLHGQYASLVFESRHNVTSKLLQTKKKICYFTQTTYCYPFCRVYLQTVYYVCTSYCVNTIWDIIIYTQDILFITYLYFHITVLL